MTALAAACGILIVVLGFWSTGRTPTEAQSVIEIVCLVGGLILCFTAVLLSRLAKVAERLEALEGENADPRPAPTAVAPQAAAGKVGGGNKGRAV